MTTEAAPVSSASLLTTGSDGEISLLDILDHVLNAGVVIHGSLVISLAGVDLVYVGLNVVLTSVGDSAFVTSTATAPENFLLLTSGLVSR